MMHFACRYSNASMTHATQNLVVASSKWPSEQSPNGTWAAQTTQFGAVIWYDVYKTTSRKWFASSKWPLQQTDFIRSLALEFFVPLNLSPQARSLLSLSIAMAYPVHGTYSGTLQGQVYRTATANYERSTTRSPTTF